MKSFQRHFLMKILLVKNYLKKADFILKILKNNIEEARTLKEFRSILFQTLRIIDKYKGLFKKRGFSLIHQNEKLIQRAENCNKENPFLIKFFDGEIRIDNDKKER